MLDQAQVDINIRGKSGRTPVMKAAAFGQKEVFDLLVRRGGDLLVVDDNEYNILHVACMGGDVEMVKYILLQGIVDVNSRGHYGRTAMMMAAEFGHGELFDFFMDKGDLSLVDNDCNNILHVACLGGNVDVVQNILSRDIVDINSRGKYDRTPTMMAVGGGFKGVFDLLVVKGADVSLVDNDGNTVLHVAFIGGHAEMVKYVLSQVSVEINGRGQYGRTPLMMSAVKGNWKAFEVLVNKGCDLSPVDNGGYNILHVACLGGSCEVVKYIVSRKIIDINSRGQYGRTPVMIAAEKGHREVLDLLMKEGGDLTQLDDDGENILHVACMLDHVEMVKYVMSLHIVDINSRGSFGRTPLMTAASGGHRDLFEKLVENGADMSLKDEDGEDILHIACLGGNVDMVKHILLQTSVDVNSKGQYGRTPIMTAAAKGHRKAFDLLRRIGADVSLADDHGNNILHLACVGNREKMLKYIISLNIIDTNARNKYGLTAAMIAIEKNNLTLYDHFAMQSGL
ncbi:ankyrin repeat domain-containing protein 50-like [Haliotis cracherodii]|uniref:ankyrin repeat domain-containing protein 50-like n=1 Tax=Haliotis cracherodii TaxID=6455 RepID=UPI0039E88DE9